MTTTESTPSTQSPLIAVRTTDWRSGLGNLIRKELGQWWTTRLWWTQLLTWLVILNGVTTMVMLDTEMTPPALLEEAVLTFLLVGATAIGIGIVLTVQGSVVGERELGTAAWVVSKPVSRVSFVLAKIFAHSVGFLATAVLIPSLVFLVEARFLLELPISYGSFALGVAVLALVVVFYVVLTLCLGTLFNGRGPVAGIGIGLILVGQFFKGMLPLSLVLVTPWLLGDVAGSFALGSLPDWNRMVPVVATTVAAIVLTVVAMLRFEREEF